MLGIFGLPQGCTNIINHSTLPHRFRNPKGHSISAIKNLSRRIATAYFYAVCVAGKLPGQFERVIFLIHVCQAT
jgi:hypothetical protein